MGKWIRRAVVLVIAAIFLFSVISIIVTLYQYRVSGELYDDVARQYTALAAGTGGSGAGGAGAGSEADGSGGTQAGLAGESAEIAPIQVDFEGLQALNGDIVGWIYCQDTPINYPVIHGEDNDFYLRRSFDKTNNMAGSIFIEALNRHGFVDSNMIIYGHHMKNGSMFAVLDSWDNQEFYEEHPVMWLLTPERDYRIDLFSGYTTSAYSDTYTIFQGPGEPLDEYLAESAAKSVFQADVELDSEARYVLLSTCAYVFDNARYVLHGKLVPADSAGGVMTETK